MRLNPFKGGGIPPPNDPEWRAWCGGYKQAVRDIKEIITKDFPKEAQGLGFTKEQLDFLYKNFAFKENNHH